MNGHTDLRIPKKEIVVEVHLIDVAADAEDFFIYLNACSQHHRGEETVDEFLNSGNQFIILKHCRTAEFFIANLNQVLYVREKEPVDLVPQTPLTIHLAHDLILQVSHCEPLPQFHARPVDFFNSERWFLPYNDRGRKIYINKNLVRKVSGL